jgi:CRP-like cAMP-binding protein
MPRHRLEAPVETCAAPQGPLDEVLGTHPFTRGLPASYVGMLARHARLRDVAAGQYLWRQGDRNVEAYLVLEGEIALEITVPHEGKLLIECVTAGDIAGCTGLFHSARWGFDGRAATAVRAVALDSRQLRTEVECDHAFGYHLLERCTSSLGKRLNTNRLKLVEAHSAVLP